jgi:hypothetical protein
VLLDRNSVFSYGVGEDVHECDVPGDEMCPCVDRSAIAQRFFYVEVRSSLSDYVWVPVVPKNRFRRAVWRRGLFQAVAVGGGTDIPTACFAICEAIVDLKCQIQNMAPSGVSKGNCAAGGQREANGVMGPAVAYRHDVCIGGEARQSGPD